jgi:hypothetical protein
MAQSLYCHLSASSIHNAGRRPAPALPPLPSIGNEMST